MVDWRPLMGTIPPLNAADWAKTFAMYQESPQFQHINRHMTLSEFKYIFFWEYLHRVLGRLIGLWVTLPFLYFLIKKKLSSAFIKNWLVVIALVGCQGLMGWYMVQSGLVDNPYVSHFRLAAHLGLAFFIFYWILRQSLSLYGAPRVHKPALSVLVCGGLLVTQIIWGAFTAGLDAGYYYNTYPKMGAEWLPEAAFLYGDGWLANALHSPILIQWIHRWLGIGVLVSMIAVWRHCQASSSIGLRRMGHLFVSLGIVQIGLGIATILTIVWLPLALLHQLGALALVATLTIIHHQMTR